MRRFASACLSTWTCLGWACLGLCPGCGDPEAAETRAMDATGTSADGPAASADLGSAPAADAEPDAPLDADSVADPCRASVVRLGDLEIFAYEASRPDATAEASGTSNAEACSVAGVQPWADATIAQARTACAASGFALCAGDDWLQVCGGDEHRLFPYGGAHRPSVCNDHITGSAAVEPTGARADCHTPEGVYDLSGNLWEMTEDALKRGGSFRVNPVDFRVTAVQCDSQLAVFPDVHSDEVGFRCCRRM